jgi:hypothetical protein
VIERAENRCEYCLFPQAARLIKHHIEHIIALKHGGQTFEENLALACPFCNEQKGTDIGSFDFENNNKFVGFFNPRTQIWAEHFQIEEDGEIIPIIPEARVTARILKFNDAERIEERRELIEAGLY